MKAKKRFGLPTRKIFLVLSGCALVGLTSPLRAADATTNAPVVSDLDPKADEWLKKMGDYLAKEKNITVHAEVWQDVQLASGQRAQAGRDLELQVRRPDRLRALVHSTRRDRELIYDGTALTLCNRGEKFYGTARASGPLDEAMDVACEKFGITLPLEDFIRSDPHKDFLEKATSGTDLGPVTVMGTPCEHLVFTQDNIDWQVWIETGAKPLPRKFVITYRDEPDSPQYTAIFNRWNFSRLRDSIFKFEPPPGATKIKVREIKAENEAKKTEAK